MTKYYVRSVSLKHLFTLVCVIVYAIIFRLRKHEGLRKKICKLLWEGKHCAQTLEHEILIWFHDAYEKNSCYFRRLYPIVSSLMSYQGYSHFYIYKYIIAFEYLFIFFVEQAIIEIISFIYTSFIVSSVVPHHIKSFLGISEGYYHKYSKYKRFY